jgi:hypothetical protein
MKSNLWILLTLVAAPAFASSDFCGKVSELKITYDSAEAILVLPSVARGRSTTTPSDAQEIKIQVRSSALVNALVAAKIADKTICSLSGQSATLRLP